MECKNSREFPFIFMNGTDRSATAGEAKKAATLPSDELRCAQPIQLEWTSPHEHQGDRIWLLVAVDTAGPDGSRRAASGAPHHEGLRFRREIRPHPEEPANGGRLEGWAAKRGLTTFYCICDSPAMNMGIAKCRISLKLLFRWRFHVQD